MYVCTCWQRYLNNTYIYILNSSSICSSFYPSISFVNTQTVWRFVSSQLVSICFGWIKRKDCNEKTTSRFYGQNGSIIVCDDMKFVFCIDSLRLGKGGCDARFVSLFNHKLSRLVIDILFRRSVTGRQWVTTLRNLTQWNLRNKKMIFQNNVALKAPLSVINIKSE